MDWLNLSGKATAFMKKYKFMLLILLIGLVLMSIPNHKDNNTDTPIAVSEEKNTSVKSVKDELTLIRSEIEDVGKEQVMRTLAAGEETLYQTNGSTQDSGNGTTVIITDADRNQHGLVRQITPPVYLGAIVICQGCDKPTVRLAVTQAVSKITGLGADSISVLKMK